MPPASRSSWAGTARTWRTCASPRCSTTSARWSLPDRILQKPDSLDEREYEEVKRHPEEGAELINRVEGMGRIAEWVRHSHEHYDGSGYPGGLAGDAIPLASRILLVADAYDAITSDRPYRSAQSQAEALEELRRNAGRQFDPQLRGRAGEVPRRPGSAARGRRGRRLALGPARPRGDLSGGRGPYRGGRIFHRRLDDAAGVPRARDGARRAARAADAGRASARGVGPARAHRRRSTSPTSASRARPR